MTAASGLSEGFLPLAVGIDAMLIEPGAIGTGFFATSRASTELSRQLLATMTASVCLFFNERLEPRQGTLPLLGDVLEVLADVINRLGFELEPGLTSHADAANDACALEDPKMLGHRLSS